MCKSAATGWRWIGTGRATPPFSTYAKSWWIVVMAKASYYWHDTMPGYVDTAPFPAAPTQWTYKAIYRVDDAQIGQPVSLAVGGGNRLINQPRELTRSDSMKTTPPGEPLPGGFFERAKLIFTLARCRAITPTRRALTFFTAPTGGMTGKMPFLNIGKSFRNLGKRKKNIGN
jgi:hypothetical protein